MLEIIILLNVVSDAPPPGTIQQTFDKFQGNLKNWEGKIKESTRLVPSIIHEQFHEHTSNIVTRLVPSIIHEQFHEQLHEQHCNEIGSKHNTRTISRAITRATL